MKNNFSILFILTITVIFSIGCAQPTPVKFDASFNTLLIYPLFDTRINKDEKLTSAFGSSVEMKNLVAHPVSSYYMARHFNCKASYAYDLGIIPNASYVDFKEQNTNKLMTLNTNGEDYVLIIFLSELNQDAVLTSVASMEAFLVKVKSGRVFWNNSSEVTIFQGVVDRALGGFTLQAYNAALEKTMMSFPVLMK